MLRLPYILSFTTLFVIIGCGGGGGGGTSDGIVTGLDVRPSDPACNAFDPEGGISIDLAPEFSTLTFTQPVALLQNPLDHLRWYVIEQSGKIHTFQEGDSASTVLIDISAQIVSGGEAGLLGMAFHPEFSANGEIYLSYTSAGTPLVSHISRVISSDDGLTAELNTETVLLSVDQPYSNHNGGWISFGPDGYLYIGIGDGGSGGDPDGNGQDTKTLLGSILRIDVSNTDAIRNNPYAIPAGNPFETSLDCSTGCPEIFAWGFRNPWRWSFDTLNGNMWAGDVGQSSKEEVNLVTSGGNYGWNTMEGNNCYPPGSACDTTGLVMPVIDYGRSDGTSVTGGYVYRGTAIPALIDSYIYGDFGSGNVWQLSPDGLGGYSNSFILNSGLNISSFGQGSDGEIYIVSYGDGRIYTIVQEINNSIPDKLSDTGYVIAGDPSKPISCFIPYEIQVPFWSDGAEKERFFAISETRFIDIREADNWQLPPGSVTLKSFWLNGRPVEMRILLRHFNGQWAGYTYEWDDAENDFIRVVGGKSAMVEGQTWIYPSESDCMRCHPAGAGRTLGLETAQLNLDFFYPRTGITANQLATYDDIRLISPRLSEPVDQLPLIPDPFDTHEDLTQRAKAYLHSNCAQCHRPGGPTPSVMDLRYKTTFGQMHICNEPVQGVDFGIADPRLVAPSDADRSLLLNRMKRRDAYSMPPIASSMVDIHGSNLIEQWIAGLSICP